MRIKNSLRKRIKLIDTSVFTKKYRIVISYLYAPNITKLLRKVYINEK